MIGERFSTNYSYQSKTSYNSYVKIKRQVSREDTDFLNNLYKFVKFNVYEAWLGVSRRGGYDR